MPIHNYGLLKGRAVDKINSPQGNQHYQIKIQAVGTSYRIAVNVKSKLTPSDLFYYLDADYKHPILDEIAQLSEGFTKIPSKPGGIALDFIKSNLFPIREMKILPDVVDGENNDLNDIFDVYINRAIRTPDAYVYAFGERWGPEAGKADRYFDFSPGNGIHDIHMNQGSTGRFEKDNGEWQDGALLIHYPSEQTWVALFLRFQSQRIPNLMVGQEEVLRQEEVTLPLTIGEKSVRIVAALVNPVLQDDTGSEKVILFNTTPEAVSLDGWALLDREMKREELRGIIQPGEMKTVELSGEDMLLTNNGGTITLVDSGNLKIDGVFYTRQDTDREGTWKVF